MRRLLVLPVMGLFLAAMLPLLASAADMVTRKVVQVPKVDPAVMTIDGQMNEAAWANAAQANIVTSTGFEMYAYYYGRDLPEPDFEELYGRMLWAKDTLYVFVHLDEVVNDSTHLFFPGKWSGDQLFVSISGKLGVNMMGWYDGNSYAAPDGPYHYWIFGDRVTLNGGDSTSVPEQYQRFPGDTLKRVFDPADYARWATVIDTLQGTIDLEMAIYNPSVNSQSILGFNLGGSVADPSYSGDSYGYWTWQPSVVDSPFVVPNVPLPEWGSDPGYFNLANNDYWAVLEFTPGAEDAIRKVVEVPTIDPALMTIDGQMNELAWANAAQANIVTSTGFEMYAYYYGRDLPEPDFEELYGRMLWAKDTLYVFVHLDEVVNDSTHLFFPGKWSGDQLFVSISGKLGVNMMGWYDGNSYAAPDGPYHYWIFGDRVTLNGGDSTSVPEQYQRFPGDTLKRVFDPADYARWATIVDTLQGTIDLEMAIYNPSVNNQSILGFNLGGSVADPSYSGDAYGYWTWQPSVVDSPFVVPNVPLPEWGSDPGYFNLATDDYWAVLKLISRDATVDVKEDHPTGGVPERFQLAQNYPNPFNPETRITYAVPRTSRVAVNVYNMLGQRVATLVDGLRPAGEYEISWHASSLVSGVYLYDLVIDGQRLSVQKMILMK